MPMRKDWEKDVANKNYTDDDIEVAKANYAKAYDATKYPLTSSKDPNKAYENELRSTYMPLRRVLNSKIRAEVEAEVDKKYQKKGR